MSMSVVQPLSAEDSRRARLKAVVKAHGRQFMAILGIVLFAQAVASAVTWFGLPSVSPRLLLALLGVAAIITLVLLDRLLVESKVWGVIIELVVVGLASGIVVGLVVSNFSNPVGLLALLGVVATPFVACWIIMTIKIRKSNPSNSSS